MVLAAATAAWAGVDEREVHIAVRALSFMEKPPVGEVRVGIVYMPGNPQSAAEADQLKQMLGDGFRSGNLTLVPVMVKIGEVANASVAVLFLTDGVGAAAEVSAAAKARRIPCVTFDITQVSGGACAMGVRTEPRIEILVNRAAAADSGVAFSTAFKMLITEF